MFIANPRVDTARRRIHAAFLLGVIVFSRPGCANPQAETGLLPRSEWGGEHIRLSVGDTIADVEFDCAHGTVRLPIMLSEGHFSASGSFTQEHGGPVRDGELFPPHAARYSGRVIGGRMMLTVTLTDEKRAIGTFDLQRGKDASVFKCL
jgi:hypothetical protein